MCNPREQYINRSLWSDALSDTNARSHTGLGQKYSKIPEDTRTLHTTLGDMPLLETHLLVKSIDVTGPVGGKDSNFVAPS